MALQGLNQYRDESSPHTTVLLKDAYWWRYSRLITSYPTKLQTKNHPKVVLVFLGGPGRNRTTDTRIFNSVPQTKLPLDLKRFTPPESNFVHKTFLGVCMGLIWLSYFDPRKECGRVWWCDEDLTDTGIATPCHDRGIQSMKGPLKGRCSLIL